MMSSLAERGGVVKGEPLACIVVAVDSIAEVSLRVRKKILKRFV